MSTPPNPPTAEPISRFDVPDLADLPDDIAAVITTIQEKSGFVPNVFLAFARRPAEFRAFFAYHDALMERPDGLTKAERELIVVATSARNNCLYCVVAHGAILRIRSKNPYLSDQVAVNPAKAELSDRERDIVALALKVGDGGQGITDDDLDAMRAKGFTDDEIWDIGAIAALFSLSNRMANFASIRPNHEFYGMGR